MIQLIVNIVKIIGLALYNTAIVIIAVLAIILDKVCEMRGCRK